MNNQYSVWNEDSRKYYLDACKYLDYPNSPMGPFFEKYIKKDDTVMDLGCGYGVAALHLYDKCKKVIAVDFCDEPLSYLSGEIENRKINNIEIIRESFPNDKIPTADVLIALYVFKIIKSVEQAKELIRITNREGFILCNHPDGDISFHDDLYNNLGLVRKNHGCENGCYVKGMFEMLGVKVECEKIEHEFGQPIDSEEDAVKFFKWQAHTDDTKIPEIRKLAPKYIEQRGNQLYIPIVRKSCVLHYFK